MTNQTSIQQRDDLSNEIWSLAEAVHGVKPRWYKFDRMSIDDMQQEIRNLNLCLLSIESMEEEMARIESEENEAAIRNVMNVCNCDRTQAIKYLDDANRLSETKY